MSEALKQHDAGELVQQNRAEARVNVGLSCLEKQPRRRRREPFLLLASNNPHAQWYFRASARYATLFLERRQVVLLPLSCLPRPIRTNSHHDISSCVLPAGAHIMVHILRELMSNYLTGGPPATPPHVQYEYPLKHSEPLLMALMERHWEWPWSESRAESITRTDSVPCAMCVTLQDTHARTDPTSGTLPGTQGPTEGICAKARSVWDVGTPHGT